MLEGKLLLCCSHLPFCCWKYPLFLVYPIKNCEYFSRSSQYLFKPMSESLLPEVMKLARCLFTCAALEYHHSQTP